MAFDALAELREAGTPVDMLSASQREVLSGLSPAEVSTLISINARIAEASDDVEGHDVVGGFIF